MASCCHGITRRRTRRSTALRPLRAGDRPKSLCRQELGSEIATRTCAMSRSWVLERQHAGFTDPPVAESPTSPAQSATIRPASAMTSPQPSATPMIKGHPVQVTPDHGPPGTVVHLEGSGFVENYWKELNGWDTPGGHREYFGLERADGDCELIVRDDYVSSSVSASGRL